MKTYELLQATFILILTSLILLIVLIYISILSVVHIYSSYDVYFTSGECVIVPKMDSTPWMYIPLNGFPLHDYGDMVPS